MLLFKGQLKETGALYIQLPVIFLHRKPVGNTLAMLTKAATPQTFSALKSLAAFTARRFSTSRPRQRDSVNEIRLVGAVGQDPKELTNNEYSSVVFFLATKLVWKRDGELGSRTDWHKVVVPQKSHQNQKNYILSYVRKGDYLMVSGRAQNSVIRDDEGKFLGSNYYVRADHVILLSKKYELTEQESADSIDSEEENSQPNTHS